MRARRGWVALALWGAGLLVACFVIARAPFNTDMTAFLPRSPVPAQRVMVDQLRDGVVSRVVLVAIEGAAPEALARLSRGTAERLRREKESFGLVGNGEETGFEGDRDLVWRNRYLLSPAVTPERFSAAALRAALEKAVRLLSSDLGILLKRSLPADPTGEILLLVDQLAGDAAPAVRKIDGVWVLPDAGAIGPHALLVLQLRAPGFDLDAQEHSLRLVDAAFAAAQREVPDAASARLLKTGPPAFGVGMRATMQSDAERLSLLAAALVATILFLAYRSPRVVALALVPVISGGLVGVAAVALGFGFIHAITLGFGVTLIGEAVDYAIYLFSQTLPGSSPDATLPRIWRTLRLGMLTSICGFSAMLLSSFTGFAQLGLFTIVGLVMALAVTRCVLPSLLPARFSDRASPIFASLVTWPAVVLRRGHVRPRVALLVISIIAVVPIALHRGSFWESDIASMGPVPAADQALYERLRGEIGAAEVRYLLVAEAAGEEEALEASERIEAMLRPLVDAGVLAGFDAPSRHLPSRATQLARQAALPDADTLKENLTQALTGLPFRPDVFAPFLADAAEAKQLPLVTRETLRGTAVGLKLESLLIHRSAGGWLAMLPLQGVADEARLEAAVAAGGGERPILLDLKAESGRLLERYVGEAQVLALTGAGVILVVLFLGLRSPARVLIVAAPLAAAVLCTASAMLLVFGKLSIFNLFGLLLVVAVGSNYALFFERQGTTAGPLRERTAASLVLANLATVVGFGVLSFSMIPVLHGIGTTVAVGALLSLFFAASLAEDAYSSVKT